MRLRNLLLLLLTFVAFSSVAADVPDGMSLGDGMKHASIGVYIADVDNNDVVVSCNSDVALVPASVVKVITAATVMKLYDKNTRWETVVGYTGEVVDGVLYGDIVVKGCIDPSLAHPRSAQASSAFVDNTIAAVEAANISRVEGDIIVDASISEMGANGDWLVEDVGFYYGAACYGVNYKANKFQLYMHTGKQGSRPEISSTSTPMHELYFHNYLTVGNKDSAMVWVAPYASDYFLTGIVPAVKDSFALNCAMADPPLKLANDIYDVMTGNDITIAGAPMTDRVLVDCGMEMPKMEQVLYKHKSDRLHTMLKTMMYHSDNLYAEAMLRYVGLKYASTTRLATSLQAQRSLWKRAGLDIDEMKIHDGSGLSRKNVVTPHFLAQLLMKAYGDITLDKSYVELFPVVGKDGTVRNFMKKKPLPGELRLKSGTMGGVLCYAGYYMVNDKTYAVVLMSNNHSCKARVVREAFENYLFDTLSGI